MSSIEDILISAQSGSQELQQRSLEYLNQELRMNPGNLFIVLSETLSNRMKLHLPRQISGIYLKNLIKNSTNDPSLQDLWLFLPGQTKQSLKSTILAMLADESRDLRQVSAQIISEISRFELPSRQWPELLNILIMNSMNVNPTFKEAALMALGYICEVATEDFFSKDEANSILTAFIAGLSEEEKNTSITKASINGLKNSLRFFKQNFMNDEERGIILSTLYRLAVHPRVEIRRESMQTIVEIAGIFYDFLENNLIDLGNLTYSAINNDDLQVAILAVEFWNTLGQIEAERSEGLQRHKGYLITAAASLTPILLSKMHIFEEDDEISLQKSCCYTLKSIAEVFKDPVVDIVYTYISTNLSSPNLKMMKSAALVFGSIMKGPSADSLGHLVRSSIGTLKKLLNNPSYSVRLAVAWCLSNIISNIEELPLYFNKIDLFEIIIAMINDKDEVSGHGCTCLNFVLNCPELVQNMARETVESLYKVTTSVLNETQSNNAHINAITVIPAIIRKSPKTCGPFFENKLSWYLEFLQQASNTLQAPILIVVEAIFEISSTASLKETICDRAMEIVLKVVENNKMAFEAGLDVFGAIADKMENRFEKYMKHVAPLLIWGLEDILALEKCKSSVMCIGDLARSLYLKFEPYLSHFIPRFSLILSNESVNLQVKIETINTLGDICGIPGVYANYHQTIIQYIDSASTLCKKNVIEEENPDVFDAINLLRSSVLCFYVNLVYGLKEANSQAMMIGRIEEVVDLCVVLTQPNYKSSPDTWLYASGLVGDIATTFRESSAYLLKTQKVHQFLVMARSHPSKEVKEIAHNSYLRINNL